MAELKLYICQENICYDEYGCNFDETKVLIAKSYEEAKTYFQNKHSWWIRDHASIESMTHEKWFDEHMILHEIPLAKIPRL